MARDGVPAWFTKPGPTTKGTQPAITDSSMREKTREKIGKVLKRQYLILTGLKIKSFIKFFAVPKGEDDTPGIRRHRQQVERVRVGTKFLATHYRLARSGIGQKFVDD